jgi:hypothetical protein
MCCRGCTVSFALNEIPVVFIPPVKAVFFLAPLIHAWPVENDLSLLKLELGIAGSATQWSKQRMTNHLAKMTCMGSWHLKRLFVVMMKVEHAGPDSIANVFLQKSFGLSLDLLALMQPSEVNAKAFRAQHSWLVPRIRRSLLEIIANLKKPTLIALNINRAIPEHYLYIMKHVAVHQDPNKSWSGICQALVSGVSGGSIDTKVYGGDVRTFGILKLGRSSELQDCFEVPWSCHGARAHRSFHDLQMQTIWPGEHEVDNRKLRGWGKK